MAQLPNIASMEVKCPNCGRYLGTVAGTYFDAPPCACGWKTTLRNTAKPPR